MAFLAGQGVRTFLEIGPDGMLSALAADAASPGPGPAGDGGTTNPLAGAAFVPGCRGADEAASVVAALGALWARGVPVDWSKVLGAGGRRVDLPTYPFQRQRYWLTATAPRRAGRPGHPALDSVADLADGDGLLLTGGFSTARQSWLADHVVLGTILVPGTALLELALHAAAEVGADRVGELTLETPLTLAAGAEVPFQLRVGAPDGTGRRPLTLHSRTGDEPWIRHASGHLVDSPESVGDGEADLLVWPPPGAEPVAVDEHYERFAAAGFDLGPAFRGLRAAWRRGDDTFAEVRLPASCRSEAGRYGVHPALLDAALHAGGLDALARDADELRGRLPFSWHQVSLRAAGPTALRVRIRPARSGDGSSVALTDETGRPVASIGALVTRHVPIADLTARHRSMFRVDWVELPVSSAEPARDVVFHPVRPADDDPATATRQALLDLRSWLTGDHAPDARLVLVTHGALAVRAGEPVPDLAAAPVWGLVRSAQTEHPDRFLLADVDEHAGSAQVLPAAVAAALAAGDPQLAVRAGLAYVPRLVRATPGAPVDGSR
ncbi:MAG TPA: polyketide synthase dehydratase domain-containing protein, partial [Micromonospora sp.]